MANNSNNFKLRPYQEELLHLLRLAIHQGRHREICYAPTGAGKTEIAKAMIQGAMKKGKRVLFICNRIELIEQASRRFDASGIDHGIIQGNHWRTDSRKQVQICSIQTLARRQLPEADLIIIDEAHGATAPQYRKIITAYNRVPVVGLTATPFSKGLGKHYDEMHGPLFWDVVHTVTARDLINMHDESGRPYLVDCKVYAPSEPDLKGVKIVAGDYDIDDLGDAVNKPQLVADIVSTWLKLADNRLTVCFATNIAHSKNIVAQFNAAGIPAEHLDAYSPPEERQEILDRLRAGVTRIVSNCSLLAEGFDLPDLGCMILARPTKSLIRHIQMAGRCLRPAPGKQYALILDHSGSTKELGFPTDDQDLTLDDGKSREAKKRERKEPLPKACPKCTYIKPAKVHKCPSCGFAPERQPEIETIAGELAELTRGVKKTQDKRKLYAELKAIARARNWNYGRADHVFKDLTGVWPNHYKDVAPMDPSPETLRMVQYLNIRFAKMMEKKGGDHAAR
jgi:superfamily II DNA or RNA helicase